MQKTFFYIFLLSACFTWGCKSSLVTIKTEASEHSSVPLKADGNIGNKINSTTDDYAPKMLGNTLIFSSGIRVPGKYPKELKSEIFEVRRDGPFTDKEPVDAGWDDIKLLGTAPFKGVGLDLNEGSFDAIPELGYGVFAAEQIVGDSDQLSLMDIYEVKVDKDLRAQSAPVPIKEINEPQAWDSQPALTEDGKTMFFVSDRPLPPATTRGNMHIYRSIKNNGVWGKPQILEAPFTTKGNDVSPFFGPDGNFYFSSDGDPDGLAVPKGLGRRDIYKVKCDESSRLIGIPKRLPPPVNSDADDDFPSLTKDCRTILLASDREGGAGKRDIYAFSIEVIIRLKGTITQQTIKNSVVSPPVVFPTIVTITDRNDPSSVITMPTDASGHYSAELIEDHEYIVTVSKPNCVDSVKPAIILAKRAGNTTDPTVIIKDFNVVNTSFAITLGKESNVPYFITGYWRPNTPENLQRFRKRYAEDQKFHDIVYIDSTQQKDMGESYEFYSHKIAAELKEKVYDPIMGIVRTRLSDSCQGSNKILRIEVDGYTDDRSITPGEYLDEDVPASGGEPEIHSGDMMNDKVLAADGRKMSRNESGNLMLSQLRAYFTMKEVKAHLSQDDTFRELLNANPPRIIFSFSGRGIDHTIQSSKGFNRRIDVTARIE